MSIKNTFNSVEDSALQALEDAITEDSMPCIGHTLRLQRKRAVYGAYKRVIELRLADALTPREHAVAREACSWLGMEVPS